MMSQCDPNYSQNLFSLLPLPLPLRSLALSLPHHDYVIHFKLNHQHVHLHQLSFQVSSNQVSLLVLLVAFYVPHFNSNHDRRLSSVFASVSFIAVIISAKFLNFPFFINWFLFFRIFYSFNFF